MTTLLAEQVRKDNTNLFRFSIPLFVEMRKLNFKKVRLESYFNYLTVTTTGASDPYPEADLRMDIKVFAGRLTGTDKEVFNLFLLGMSPKEIIERVEGARATVYRRLESLLTRFKEFYVNEC